MMAIVPIIFIIVLLGAVCGYVKQKQVVIFIIFLAIGPMLISIALSTAGESLSSLPLMLKISTLVIMICVATKLIFPGNTWLLVLNFTVLLPFRIAGWLIQLLFELFGYKYGSNKKPAKRPRIDY